MKPTRKPRLLLLPLLACALPAIAGAEVARDAASGLQVDPPPGYMAQASTPRPGQAARFEVKMPADRDTGCQVAFTPAPQNNRLSQAQIDGLMRGEEWRDKARTALSGMYDVTATMPFKAGSRQGYALVADFKDRPNLPERAKVVRTLFVIQETPRGRTSTVCVGEKAGFEERQKEFLAVAAGASPP